MNAAGGATMPRRDPFRRFLERVLPWFDREAEEREQAAVDRQLEASRRAVLRTERILAEVRRVERVIVGQR